MKKKIWAIVMTVLLTIIMVLPVSAEAGKMYIIDQLGVVTDYISELNQKASQLSDQYGITVSLLMMKSTEGLGTPVAGENIYKGCFEDADGIMLVYSEDDSEWFVYKSGSAEALFSSDDEDAMWNAFVNQEYYDECVDAYLDEVSKQLEMKIGTQTTEKPAASIPDERLKPLLVDDADLLTDSEEKELLAKLEEISKKQKCEVAVVTVDGLDGKTAMEYADDYYDYNGYGYGENRDGILLLISMADRDWWMTTHGYGITAFTDEGMNYMKDKFLPYISDADYKEGFDTYADLCDDFITQAREGNSYDVGNLPKGIVPPFWILGDLAIGLFIGFIMASIRKNSLKTVRKVSQAQDYTVPGSMVLTMQRDMLVNKTLTTRRIERDSESSGGSSTHSSSSGSTHGGSGGKF